MAEYREGNFRKMLEEVLPKAKQAFENITQDKWDKFTADYMNVFMDYCTRSYEKYSKMKTVICRYELRPLLGEDGFFVIPYAKGIYKRLFDEGMDRILLWKNNCIIIQGTGGIGKSTLMRYLFLDALEGKGYIPMFIELREINNIDGEYDLEEVLFSQLFFEHNELPKEFMKITLSSGMYLFFLDGYDEIQTDKRLIFYQKLERIIDKYPKNMFMLSSRPFSDFLEMHRFSVVSLHPFTKEQAIEQIRKLGCDDKELQDSFVRDLENDLYDNHKDFASNPLLLNIMLLTYEEYAYIPDKLYLFYEEAFSTMFSKHDAIKGLFKRQLKCRLSYDDYKSYFAHFCFCTYIEEKTFFTRDDIKEVMDDIHYTFDIDDFISDLHDVLCVINLEGLGYSFSHRSFQEYFAAYYLKEQDDVSMESCAQSMLESNPFSLNNDNVFSLLYAMCDERFKKNIVLPIIKKIEMKTNDETVEHLVELIKQYVALEEKPSIGYVKLGFKYDEHTKNINDEVKNYIILLCELIIFTAEHIKPIETKWNYLKEWDLFQILQEKEEFHFDEKGGKKAILLDTWLGCSIYSLIEIKNEIEKGASDKKALLKKLIKNNRRYNNRPEKDML